MCKPDSADLWNYDYAGRWGRNRKNNKANRDWTDIDFIPKIRGRKFYWHYKFNESNRPYLWENHGEVSERNVMFDL